MALRGDREHGQSTVEFGAAAIVLVLILFGIIDLGRAYYFSVGLLGAAREGARQASWFDPTGPDLGCGPSPNPYLCDSAVKAAVDRMLEKSGLPDSQLANPGTTCPTTSDGNADYNPPYQDANYPSSVGQPQLFICYSETPGLDLTSAPISSSYNGSDVEVVLLMNFGFVSGLLGGIFGSSVHMVANAHMTVGGGYS